MSNASLQCRVSAATAPEILRIARAVGRGDSMPRMSGPALWVVERSASKVFLFGETVGVRRDDVWFVDPIRAAFDESHEFWCEVADAEEIARSSLVTEYGLSSRSLSSRLNDRDLRSLQEAALAVDVDPTTLEGL